MTGTCVFITKLCCMAMATNSAVVSSSLVNHEECISCAHESNPRMQSLYQTPTHVVDVWIECSAAIVSEAEAEGKLMRQGIKTANVYAPPASLLEGMCWTVTELPDAALTYERGSPSPPTPQVPPSPALLPINGLVLKPAR
jgi:hypothetical protein